MKKSASIQRLRVGWCVKKRACKKLNLIEVLVQAKITFGLFAHMLAYAIRQVLKVLAFKLSHSVENYNLRDFIHNTGGSPIFDANSVNNGKRFA